MKLSFLRSKPAFLATSCNSSPKAPCHPTGPQQANRMLPAQLLYWKAACGIGSAVPGTQPLQSPCISSSPPSNSIWKMSGKRRQFHVRNVTLEVLTASDRHRSCYILHENSLSPGLTPVGGAVLIGQLCLLKLSQQFQFATVLFTSFYVAVECYSMLTSSHHLSPMAVASESHSWACTVSLPRTRNVLGFLGGEQCYVSVES